MLAGFADANDLNLIVAPHVKMFRRHDGKVRDGWRARRTANVLIDPGSDQSVDTSYAAIADIYVGDVSSQVYEFLVRPRPCVFLNAHAIDWRDDPSFVHWQLGDVIDDPSALMAAIRAAPGRHHLYRARQEALAAATLGDRSPGAARRAADAVASFLQ
jgi:CDP-glycerol glycerophosphotransferase (TagB/SpsB family)